jgi:hypothetical protein
MKKINFILSAVFMFCMIGNQLYSQNNVLGEGMFNSQLSVNGDGRPTGGGTTTSGANSGAGELDFKINTNMPGITILLNKETELEWSCVHSSGVFNVKITNDDSGDVVYQAMTRNKSIILPLDALALDEESYYSLQISDTSTPALQSAPTLFKVRGQAYYDKVIKNIRDTDHFQAATSGNKVVMKAMQLELNDLNYEASKVYESHLANDDYGVFLINMRDQFNNNMKAKTDFSE